MLTLIVATHNEGKLEEMRHILQQELGSVAQQITLVSAGALHLPDPQETGVTFEENAILKARVAAETGGFAAIADDSGLIVDVLGNAPGILSARWSGVHGRDNDNNALLLAQLADIPDHRRTARFCSAAALVVPQNCKSQNQVITKAGAIPTVQEESTNTEKISIQQIVVKTGEMRGVIIRKPRGEHGFGYDPIFVPFEQNISVDSHTAATNVITADMSDEEICEVLQTIDVSLLRTSAQLTEIEKNAISHRGKALRAIMPAIKSLLSE